MTLPIDLSPALRDFIAQNHLDTVDGAFAYTGGELLTKPGLGNRERIRLAYTDADGTAQHLYLKRYHPGGPPSQTDGPTEFATIRAVREAGVPTMRELTCGHDAAGRSFLLVTAVPGDALERTADDFLCNAGPQSIDDLNTNLAYIASTLHTAGLVHRDFYASHVFLDDAGERPELYLIDLARVFRPRWRTRRWRVKDLAQLKYSMPAHWVANCWRDFLDQYERRMGVTDLDRAIDRKVAIMRQRDERRAKRRQP